jgi:hypothetical protein
MLEIEDRALHLGNRKICRMLIFSGWFRKSLIINGIICDYGQKDCKEPGERRSFRLGLACKAARPPPACGP